MSRPCFRLAPLALLLTLAPATSADDFRDLFDGKSLDGWVVEGPAKDKTGRMMWSVEDRRIVCLGEGFGFLRYDRREFSDFTLRVEYRFNPTPGGKPPGNSGLGIRTGRFDPERSRETRPSYAAFEVQLLDDAGSPHRPTGPGRSIDTRARRPTRRGRPASGTRSRWRAPAPGSRSGSTARRSWRPTSPNSSDVKSRPAGRRLRRTSLAGGSWHSRATAAGSSSERSRSARSDTRLRDRSLAGAVRVEGAP